MAVFTALTQQADAIQLPALLEILGPGFAERSVRRWLSELAAQGRVEKTGEERGTYYRAIARDVMPTPPDSFFFIQQTRCSCIKKPLFQRKSVTYNKAWIEAYQPNGTTLRNGAM